jgi:ribosomal protein S6--L-glutamate ligase
MGLGDEPAVYWRRRKFPRSDVVVPRIGLSIHQYGLSVVNQLELMGIPVLNGAYGVAASRNKMRSLQLLAAAGVRVPRTVMAADPSGLKEMVKLVGGVPVLVKLLSANEKSGAMICESLQSLEAALEAILGLGQNIVVQQYLRGAKGRDLRVLVVGGEVVAAMRRSPPVGRFSRNLRRGAQFEPVDLPTAYLRVAVAAARVMRLEVCAVDMLDVRGTPLVFEVNSSPSIREAETACGVDAAARIVERAVALAEAPRGRGRTAAAPADGR